MENSPSVTGNFLEQKESLLQHYLFKKDSVAFSSDYTNLIESVILSNTSHDLPLSICATGSFGRRELSPYSDIDIMFLLPTDKLKTNDALNEIKHLITTLWDLGIEASQTVREISDIHKFSLSDLQAFTQFFETRFICGDKYVYSEWQKELKNVLTKELQVKLVTDFISEFEERHKKYGSSPKVIEPHIKNSAGGLRDFQLLEWLFALEKKEIIYPENKVFHSFAFLDRVEENNISSPAEVRRLKAAYSFLLQSRNFLHIKHHRKNDRLEFDDQIYIAGALGYKGKDAYLAYMREYFSASNTIHRFTKSFLKRIKRIFFPTPPDNLAIDIDSTLKIKGDIISVTDTSVLSAGKIMKAFYFRGLHKAYFDENLRNIIVESLDSFDENNAEALLYFRKILGLNKNVGSTLIALNELEVLPKLIRHFADLSGFIQHGVYHAYSADEHTLKTIENVEKLEESDSVLGNVFRNLPRRDLLYVALLFHDIAKPVSISGHALLGAEIAPGYLDRMGYEEPEIELVTFLIKNHLVMEQVAFRRNLSDADTLNSFASRFTNTEQLDHLFLLTYADLSAVNPALWTNWKQELLNELYRKTKAMLVDKISGEELLKAPISLEELVSFSQDVSPEHITDHINSFSDPGYVSHFTDEEITSHILKIRLNEKISLLFKESELYTNVTIITDDSPYLLSKICGVFAINDVNIHDARIFTRNDGMVIDNFNITDFRTNKKIEPSRYQKIRDDMESVISGMMQIGAEIKNMKSRWKRLENKLFKKTGNVRVKFEEHEKYTIIDLFSPDRLGFLYQVTRKMNELGLNIHFAKITTQGDEIIDAFYVLDRHKKRVSKNFYHFIESELRSAIQKIL